MLLLSLISTAQAQTNVIYGYVSDYTGQPPGTRYTISLKLLAPNPRWNGSAITKVDTMPVSVNLTNGYFSVTNLLSGYYQWTISGVNGTAFNKWVYPTTEGRVPLGSLDGGDPNLIPPNPSTNYYTQAQVDALLAEVETGTGSGGITNGQAGVGFPSLTLTNGITIIDTLGVGVALVPSDDQELTLGGSLKVAGQVNANGFFGDGAGLTNLATSSSGGSGVDAGGVPYAGELDLVLTNSHRGVVHPNFIALKTNWNGAQYWLAITGAGTNTAVAGQSFEENEVVHVFASSDLVNWTAKGAQPIITRAAARAAAGGNSTSWCADPEIYLAPDGIMRVLFGVYSATPASGFVSNALVSASSSDGTNWTFNLLHKGPNGTNAVTSTNTSFAGQQIVRDHTNGLRLYFVDDGLDTFGTNLLKFVPAVAGDESGTNWNWAGEVVCSLTPYQSALYAPWHFSLNYVDRLYHLVYGSQQLSLGEYSVSTDGINWSPPGMGVFERDGLLTGAQVTTYKSAMRPVAGANGVTWDTIVGTAPSATTNAAGYRSKLIRGMVIDGNALEFAKANTNWILIGGDKLYGAAGIERPAPLVIRDNRTNTSAGTWSTHSLMLGGLGYGYAGMSVKNQRMDFTNFAFAGNGVDTILNVDSATGTMNFRQANTQKGGLAASGGWWFGGYGATNATLTTGQVRVGELLAGPVTGSVFTGSGSGLTDAVEIVAGANINITTNSPRQFTISGTSNGGGLTNLNASALFSGTVAPERINYGDTNITGTISVTNGKVGLGIAAPVRLLQLPTNGGYENYWDTTGLMKVGGDLNARRFVDYDSSAYYLDPGNATTSLLVAGNVGIGVTSATTRLQVSGTVTASNYIHFVPTNYLADSSVITNIPAGNYPFGAFGCLMANYTNTVSVSTGVYTNIASGAAYTRILTNGFTGSQAAGTLAPVSDGYYGIAMGATVRSTTGLNGDELELELFVNGLGQEYFASYTTCGGDGTYTRFNLTGVMFLKAGQSVELRVKNISGSDSVRLSNAYLKIGAP